MARLMILLTLVAATQGCVSELPTRGVQLDPESAFDELVVNNPYGVAADLDVLALPPRAEPVLDAALEGKFSKSARLKALGALFVEGGALDLHYESMATGTAAQTFETHQGNCLAYTHLFIAMARSRGLDARYREVLGVPQWSTAGEYVMLNRHIAAYGEFGRGGTYVADFGFLYESERNFGRVISDDRARAQHFNNLGARALVADDAAAAIRYFARGLIIDAQVGYLWTNLGTAYLRDGDPRRAEIALQRALQLSAWDVTALNQLTRLYTEMGRDDLAVRYRRRSETASRQNPYLQFQWGIEARDEGHLDVAVKYLRRATASVADELYFWLELGKTQLMRGDRKAAQRALYRADALVTTNEQREALRATVAELMQLNDAASGNPAPGR